MDLYQATKRDATIALAHFLNHPTDDTRDAAHASVEAHLRVCKNGESLHRQVYRHGRLKQH